MKTFFKLALLLVPCILALAVPIYNVDEPRLFGFPFFYWSLFALVPVSALFIYAVFRIDKSEGRVKDRAKGRS